MKELRKSQNMPQLLQILAATHQKPLKCKILHPYNYYYLQWVFPTFLHLLFYCKQGMSCQSSDSQNNVHNIRSQN
jgi:hypothetical protein